MGKKFGSQGPQSGHHWVSTLGNAALDFAMCELAQHVLTTFCWPCVRPWRPLQKASVVFGLEMALKVLNHLDRPQGFAERDTEFSFLTLNIRGSGTGRRKHVVSWQLGRACAAMRKVSNICMGDHVYVSIHVTTWDSLLLWPLPGLQDEPRPQGAPEDTFILTPMGWWFFLWISVMQSS